MLTAIVSALPFLIRLVETIFPSKSGPAKLAAVAGAAQTLAQGVASAAGPAVAVVPDMAAITAQVQALVNEMNAKGELVGAATALVPMDASKDDARRVLAVLVPVANALGLR